MDKREQAWRDYLVDTISDDASDWTSETLGDWAWAECVAWHDGNALDDDGDDIPPMEDIVKWLTEQNDEHITQDMVEWAIQHAKDHNLDGNFCLL